MLHDHNSEINELKNGIHGEVKSFQLPANLVASEFGEVNTWRNITKANSEVTECRVEFTIAMEPQGRFAEGWRTGLALDASASMKRAYGRKVEARVDPELLTDYIKQGRLRSYLEDGEPIRKIQRDAFAEIQERGYEINFTENILQPLVQDFTAYLSGTLDGTGKTSLIYWGCGNGDEIQVLGEFDEASSKHLEISGPTTFQLGKATKLLPAIAHFTGRYSTNQYNQSQRGMYIFLTDGRIDDLEEIKNYTKELALEIAVGKRNYLKLVLIGVGNEVDRYQLQELDDFDTGLDLDLWDYKIASEMTSLSQIFAEVVNENQIIAENGSIYDDNGVCVKSYLKGLPAKVDFMMRDDSQWFELEVNNQRIRQPVIFDVSTAIAPLEKKRLLDFEIKAQENSQVEDQTGKGVQVGTLIGLWKILAGVLIGIAFVGTAIAFLILIKKSDDNKLQNRNQAIPMVIKESFLQTQATVKTTAKPISKVVSKEQPNNSPTRSSKPNLSSKNLSTNVSVSVTVDNPKKTTGNASIDINKSIVPITNPDIEVVVFFTSDESQLIATEELKIDGFWAKIRSRKGVIQISGHTDKTGDYAYNLDLSQLRVNEVVRLLRDRGLDNNYQVTFEALSSLQPQSKQSTATDNALNRRVVIQFKEK